MPNHLSSFELDVYHASSVAERQSAEGQRVARHVATCSQCREYLESLDALAREAPFEVGRHDGATSGDDGLRAARRRRHLASAAGALALAAAVALYVRSRPTVEDGDAGYVGVKGSPAAQILLRRDGRVRVWDGFSPVRAGDALALSVACEGFTHVTVVAAGPAGPARAWEGACPNGPSASTLPFTLLVDDQPGREQFTVVLTRAPVDEARLGTVIAGAAHDGDAWTMDFSFAKEE